MHCNYSHMRIDLSLNCGRSFYLFTKTKIKTMKRLIILMLLSAAFFVCNAQEVLVKHSFRSVIGKYNPRTEKWTYDNPSQVLIKFTLYKDRLYIENQLFKLLVEHKREGYTYYDAVDYEGDQCKIKFTFNKATDSPNITLFYGNFCIVYDIIND